MVVCLYLEPCVTLYTLLYKYVCKYVLWTDTNLMLKNIHHGIQQKKQDSERLENAQRAGGRMSTES